MPRSTILVLLVLGAFGAFSGYSLLQFGYVGLFREALQNPATLQVFFDLCIALTLVCIWIVADARRSGRKAWPYLLMTLALGSFGPLFYLLLRRTAPATRAAYREVTAG